ncbi:MAG: hypothetical protein NZ581_08895, partial [Candidatus Caldarchaeum sp.]|nr:hypothetical protein [Candidatus Caldarchaeum sp.]MDW8436289.1 type III-B CRISPR module-associated Cmr3 family protein [Candidatus Caldarchaeum sp.]
MKSILFRILEPMMFGGAAEFTPTLRGPQTGAVSMFLPSPSTVVGALATLVLQHGNRHPPRGNSGWGQEVSEVFGGAGSVVLRGPFLVDGRGTVYVLHRNGFVPLDTLLTHLSRGGLREAYSVLDSLARQNIPGRVEVVGIKIAEPKKAAAEGFIYNVRMVDYSKLSGVGNVGWNVVVEVLKENGLLQRALRVPKVMRLGGEGRLTVVTSGDSWPVRSYVEKGVVSSPFRLYVASPLVFESSKDAARLETVDGEVVSLRWKADRFWRMSGLMGVDVDVVGHVGLIGGFSASRAVRKPVYACLQPGSIIEVVD